jgi:hypothetical protein
MGMHAVLLRQSAARVPPALCMAKGTVVQDQSSVGSGHERMHSAVCPAAS